MQASGSGLGFGIRCVAGTLSEQESNIGCGFRVWYLLSSVRACDAVVSSRVLHFLPSEEPLQQPEEMVRRWLLYSLSWKETAIKDPNSAARR